MTNPGWRGYAAEIHIRRDCGGVVPSEMDAQMVSLFGTKVQAKATVD